MVGISNLDISDDLNRKIKMEQAIRGITKKPEAVIAILEEYFKMKEIQKEK